jgi:antitoxin MazE
MEVSVVKIGNSRGIRFSKTIIERYNIRDSVEMILDKGHIIIKPPVLCGFLGFKMSTI